MASGPLVVLAVLATLLPRAHARKGGFVGPCARCHRGGQEPTVTITADATQPDPGSTITLTVHISRTNGDYGGFFIQVIDAGMFELVSGEGTWAPGPLEVTHTMPKLATVGDITFRTRWIAPGEKGGVDFEAWGVSADGNGARTNDGASVARLSMTFGCPGVSAFIDADKDGYGDDTRPTRTCAIGPGYAARGGDCDDSNEAYHPGAAEQCNGWDDNCNGQIDEAGHISCGMGVCKREGTSCDPKSCTPGTPRAETCNGLDDDCDGLVDNGARTCGSGMICVKAQCLKVDDLLPDGSYDFDPTEEDAGVNARDGGTADVAHASRRRTGDEGCAVARGGPGARGAGSAGGLAFILLALALAAKSGRRPARRRPR